MVPVEQGSLEHAEPAQRSETRNKHRHDPRTLFKKEIFWRDHQEWLADRGYMLRPRFRPGWIPSWGSDKHYHDYEDGQWNFVRHVRFLSPFLGIDFHH